MKLSERIIQFVEDKLEDEDSVARIRSKIIAPAINILRDEITNTEATERLTSMITTFIWPVLLVVSIVLFMVFLILGLQIYQISRVA
tara:strand:- start:649 stop:909 length:261 start_codon:yes stop_codon:yes gene_type:complete